MSHCEERPPFVSGVSGKSNLHFSVQLKGFPSAAGNAMPQLNDGQRIYQYMHDHGR